MYHFARWANPTIATVMMMSKWDGQAVLNMADRYEMFTIFSLLVCFAIYFLFLLSSSGPMAAHDTQFFRRCVRSMPPFICGCNNSKKNEWIKKGASGGVSAPTPQNDTQEIQGKKRKGAKPSQSQGPSGPHSPFHPVDNVFFFQAFSCHQKHEIKPLVPIASHSLILNARLLTAASHYTLLLVTYEVNNNNN